MCVCNSASHACLHCRPGTVIRRAFSDVSDIQYNNSSSGANNNSINNSGNTGNSTGRELSNTSNYSYSNDHIYNGNTNGFQPPPVVHDYSPSSSDSNGVNGYAHANGTATAGTVGTSASSSVTPLHDRKRAGCSVDTNGFTTAQVCILCSVLRVLLLLLCMHVNALQCVCIMYWHAAVMRYAIHILCMRMYCVHTLDAHMQLLQTLLF
jgi:hypothetical protein